MRLRVATAALLLVAGGAVGAALALRLREPETAPQDVVLLQAAERYAWQSERERAQLTEQIVFLLERCGR